MHRRDALEDRAQRLAFLVQRAEAEGERAEARGDFDERTRWDAERAHVLALLSGVRGLIARLDRAPQIPGAEQREAPTNIHRLPRPEAPEGPTRFSFRKAS